MDYFREKISGNKNRYTEEGFNLDLSYITPRIIAMANPGEGFRKLYRNSIDTVKKFLDKRHNGKYLVINISGTKYSYSTFDNKVIEYDWIDHQAPKISTLFLLCRDMYEFLAKDDENIIVVNCRGGKGRTGTVICSFLLFTGVFYNPKEALTYYAKKRFKCGEGVTQPSQKRYVCFFYEVITNKILYPLRIIIESICLGNIPKIEEKECIRPYIDIFLENTDKLSFTTNKDFSEQRKLYVFKTKDNLVQITDSDFSYELVGDFTICVNEKYKMSSDRLYGRISYNTAFLNPKGGLLNFKLEQIDPDNLIKNKDYTNDFTISVSFSSK